MKFKTKLVSILTLFLVVFSFMIVGVLAVKQTNFNVGGNINFRATGINAVISEGTLNNALWVDESEAENKLKEIILNTYKTGEEIEEEFLSWQGLNLMFNENGDDATITFSITNTSEHEEYFSVNASVNQGTSTNATVDITPKMVELAPGDTQAYTITFSVTDPEINASILDFKIDLDMQLINILTASEYPTLTFTFTYDTTAKTASVKANTSNKPTGDLVLPSFVKYNNEVYKVTSITAASSSKYGAFYNCTGLTNITIPNSIISIGAYAFHSCTGLSSMNYLGDINEWVSISFSDLYSTPTQKTKQLTINGEIVTNAVIDNATSINAYAFAGCATLQNITLGDQVIKIGKSAFNSCTGLVSIGIPKNVTSIGERAFYSCTGLKGDLIIPDSVTSLGAYAFDSCSGLDGVLKISSNIKTIPDCAFNECKNFLGELVIPNGVTTINDRAFYNCRFSSVTIPESIINLEDEAFDRCNLIASVNYLGDINSWVSISFEGNWSNPTYYAKSLKINGEVVTNAVIDKATSINAYAFRNCATLKNITIGNQVTNIGTQAFYGCSGLTGELVIPSGVTSISGEAFSGCGGLSNIVIPESVESIGNYAFYNCSGLTNLVIPENVKTIGNSAFSACTGLTGELVIPSRVTSIGNSAFKNCSSLTSINILKGVTSIGDYTFQYCTGLSNIVIPESVESIGTYAFATCSGLTNLVIPENVKTIGNYAFLYCSKLTTVAIDSSTIAGAISGTGTSACGGLIAIATAIYVKTDIVSSLNSYVTTNWTVVTEITEGEYAGYTLYAK